MDRLQQEIQEQQERVLRSAGQSLPRALTQLTRILGVMGTALPDEECKAFAEEWKDMLERIRQVHNRVFHPARSGSPLRKDRFVVIKESIPGDFPTPKAIDWLSEQLKELRKGM